MEQVIQRPRCKKCGSTQTYIRSISKQRVCRVCGHIENLTETIIKKEEVQE